MKIKILITFFFLITSNAFANKNAESLLEYEKNTIKIFEDSVGSVVHITNIKLAKSWTFGSTEEIPRGSGSGFVWDNKGHIVTNYHVVDGGDSFRVSFHKDKTEYQAMLVGGEPKKDIAVLKLTKLPQSLKPSIIGSSQNLLVGQSAIAIGNPFGLDHTMTVGIISALGRKIEGYGGVQIHDMVQTDAAINRGNSGGPLLNSKGEVIGMNTLIFSPTGTSSGIGFAVPIDAINRIVPDLIKFGKVIRPGLGIVILEDQYRYYFGVEDGTILKYVDKNGAAGKAGLEGMSRDRSGRFYLGDIILDIDGKKVNNLNDIYHILESYKIGDSVTLNVKRNTKLLKVKVVLQAL